MACRRTSYRGNCQWAQRIQFRNFKTEDEDAFKNAEKAKKTAQDLYFQLYKDTYKDSSIAKEDDFVVVNFNTTILQVRDDALPEPDRVKTFIRKFKITCTLLNGTILCPPMEKILPDWVSKIYVENRVSMAHFLEICRRIFSLEMAVQSLRNEEILKKIKERFGDKQLILLFDHKLLYNSSLSNNSSLLDLLKRANDALDDLKDIVINQNWLLLGYFGDFTYDNDLLKDVSERLEGINIEKLFVTDYLLLNNAEFVTQKPNTENWPEIVLAYSTKNMSKESESAYFYVKKNISSVFYRFEMYKKGLIFELVKKVAKQVQGQVDNYEHKK